MEINQPAHQWQLAFETEWPTSVAFLGSHRRLAAGNRLGQIFIWDLPETPPIPEPNQEEKKGKKKDDSPPNHDPTRQLIGHTNGITHLRTLPDGKTLISASLDHTIRLWDVDAAATGSAQMIMNQKSRDRDSKYGSKESKDKIQNAPPVSFETVESSRVLKGHGDWVRALGITPDGRRLISGDDRCLSIVWDLASSQPVAQWHGYDRVWVRSAAISPDGKTAFTCEYADRRSNFDAPAAQVRLWNADDGTLQRDLLKTWTPDFKDDSRKDTYEYRQTWTKLLKRGLVCAEFSSDGGMIAVGQGGETDTGEIHLVEVESGKILRTMPAHKGGVCDVKFSADGKYLLSSGRDTMVRIFQVADGKEVATLGKSRGGQFKDWLLAIAISPDQSTVAAADIAGMIHVWKL